MRRRKTAITTDVCSARNLSVLNINVFLSLWPFVICVCCSSSTSVGTRGLLTRWSCVQAGGVEQDLQAPPPTKSRLCTPLPQYPPLVFPKMETCFHCPNPSPSHSAACLMDAPAGSTYLCVTTTAESIIW